MNIDKKELKNNFINKDYDSVFLDAQEISLFIINRKFNIASAEEKEDICQDCLLSLWDKVLKEKIDVSKGDLFSFIWRNSTFKINEVLRKKNRRNRIARMVELNTENDSADDWKQRKFGMLYNPEILFFYNQYLKEKEENDKSNKKSRKK